MYPYKAKRFQLVELQIPVTVASAGQKVYFQDQPQLRTLKGNSTVYIQKIETYSVESVPASPLSANPVANAAAIRNAVLVLNVEGTEAFQYIPLARLNTIYPGAATGSPYTNQELYFKDLKDTDWSKSYVQFAVAPAGTPFSYLFGIYYDYVNF